MAQKDRIDIQGGLVMKITTYFEKVIEELNSKPYHIASKKPVTFYLISKEDGILSGVNEVESLLNLYDIDITFRKHKENGQTLKRGEIVCSFSGNLDRVYHVLETVKFILGKMTGISTMVNFYQSRLKQSRIIDLGYYGVLSGIDQVAYKDAKATVNPYYVVDEAMVDLSMNIKDAVDLAKTQSDKPIAVEVNDITKFYEALESDVAAIIIKYFNDEAIRRAVLDNKGKKVLVVGGLILPNRLDVIGSYQFDYLHTVLFNQAARIIDFAVKVGI